MARILIFFIALGYTGTIIYLSLIDLTQTPVKDLGMSDKIMHMAAYFGMAVLWSLFSFFYFKNTKYLKKIVIVCALTIIFGILIELLQGVLTTYRESDIYDILANSTGAIFAGILVWLLKGKFNQVKI